MKTRLLCLALVLLLMVGCSKEKEEASPNPDPTTLSCKLMKSEAGNNGFIKTYYYDTKGLLIKVNSVLPGTTQNANYYELEYDVNGKLIKTVWSNPSTNFYYHLLYSYNSTGQLVRLDLNTKNSEGTYVPVNYYVYEYNSSDELKNRRLYNIGAGSDELVQTEDFFYEKGLMVKVELKVQNEVYNKTYLLEYDDKNNLAHDNRVFNFQGYGYPFKHNITKTTVLNYKGQVILNESSTISYTYNQQGYPLTLSGLSQSNRSWDETYTYNCK